MKCENCGAELVQNASFCGNCGTAISQSRQNAKEQMQYSEQLNTEQTYYGDGFGYYQTTTVGFGEAVRRVFTHYADFDGRSSRTEFWWGFLFLNLVSMLTACIPFVNIVASLGLLVPNLSIRVRRLHDMGLSGWFMLLVLLPGIGAIVLIVLWCMPSEGDNQWGYSVRIE